ncbi:hypothetical protein BU17DRAFT_61181 [Hysterangium stoloniferum]|nr:hypothetical protein BU17DRAFT_61181 [Hysterangium stoloniferum]
MEVDHIQILVKGKKFGIGVVAQKLRCERELVDEGMTDVEVKNKWVKRSTDATDSRKSPMPSQGSMGASFTEGANGYRRDIQPSQVTELFGILYMLPNPTSPPASAQAQTEPGGSKALGPLGNVKLDGDSYMGRHCNRRALVVSDLQKLQTPKLKIPLDVFEISGKYVTDGIELGLLLSCGESEPTRKNAVTVITWPTLGSGYLIGGDYNKTGKKNERRGYISPKLKWWVAPDGLVWFLVADLYFRLNFQHNSDNSQFRGRSLTR